MQQHSCVKHNYTHVRMCIYPSLFIPIVTPPTSVNITSDPANPVRPIGSTVNLTCIVELSPVENISVTVNTLWTGPDGFMTTNTAQPVMGSTTTYTSRAIVNSFWRDQSGVYNCTATASTIPLNPFLISGVMSGVERVTVGENLHPLV